MRCSMVWDLFRTKKEKPAAGKTGYWRTFWRKRWDSNPRTLADQLISSQSRYDHFDTLPYLSQHQHLRKRGELMGRTSKNIKFRIPEKPRKIKGFRNGGFPIATTISSQPRYDHFDTSPYMLTRHTEINAIFSCIRIPVRTGVVLETMECPKTAQLKAFWKIDFRLAKKISSQPRYDHFDISPY